MKTTNTQMQRANQAVLRAMRVADEGYNNKQTNGSTKPVLFMNEADRMVSAMHQLLQTDRKLDPKAVGKALTKLAQTQFISTFNASREAFNPFLRSLEVKAALPPRSLGTVKPGFPEY